MILVTGGTGLVGAHLLYNLTQQHDKLRAIRRSSSDIGLVRRVFGYYSEREEADQLFNRIDWVNADINDIPSLSESFKGVEYVYHSAALISFDPADEKRLRKSNIEGTANIVNLCISNKIKKLCYVSSVAAIGSSKTNSEVTEETMWNPENDHNDYAISKYGAEIEVWRGTQEGINTIIVNPGVILGPGFWDSGSGKIFKKIDNGLKYHFPKVTGFVGVKDVVACMIELMDSSVKNEKFILVSENLSFETILKNSAEYLEKPIPHRQLKKWMIGLGWFFQKIGSLFGQKREITRDSINGLFAKTYYSNSKIRETLDFKFTPINTVLKETAEVYKNDEINL